MLDINTRPDPEARCWPDTLAAGDVIALPDHRPGGDGTPHLVLDAITLLGDRFVALAPGVACRASGETGYDIEVSQPGACRAAKLASPTCFRGGERRMVALATCGPAGVGGRYLGRLTGEALERMQVVRARIEAERDSGVDCRRRRAVRRRPAVRGEDFEVARRHPRPRLASRLASRRQCRAGA